MVEICCKLECGMLLSKTKQYFSLQSSAVSRRTVFKLSFCGRRTNTDCGEKINNASYSNSCEPKTLHDLETQVRHVQKSNVDFVELYTRQIRTHLIVSVSAVKQFDF